MGGFLSVRFLLGMRGTGHLVRS